MASNTYADLTNAWAAGSRYTAGAAVDILLSNPSGGMVFFAVTDSDVAPVELPWRCNPLPPKSVQAMQLAAGERLWLAGDGNTGLYDAFANIEV